MPAAMAAKLLVSVMMLGGTRPAEAVRLSDFFSKKRHKWWSQGRLCLASICLALPMLSACKLAEHFKRSY